MKKILDYNKNAQRFLSVVSEFDKKKNQNQRLKKVLQREQNKEEKGLVKLKEKKKTLTINCLIITLAIQTQAICVTD